ncbi:MAG TPA: toll/interleukin-1 receptor domain-containing protein [Hyphomicrobium sp.]|nr:toll/interleukin-1 receptor domain-containing protein [Hyphomicrobium sp.]
MKIFISWSGDRSEAVAKALREWLPLVLHFADPWLSQSDIQAGERWGVEVAKELEGTNFGILCITRENISSPWLLFEAGALAKSMQDGRVIPLILDLDFKDISGPLAQFQAKKVESAGLKELVYSLNRAAATPVAEFQLEKLFTALFPDLDRIIQSIPKSGQPAKHNRSQGDILEELVSSVRTVELRFREIIDDDGLTKKRRRGRIHPLLLRDISIPFMKNGNPIFILILMSAIRDEAPWLYEIALDVYRATQTGKEVDVSRSFKILFDALDMILHTPLADELRIDRSIIEVIKLEISEGRHFRNSKFRQGDIMDNISQ